jgi:N-acetylglucosamine-6-phosphate deacetylase
MNQTLIRNCVLHDTGAASDILVRGSVIEAVGPSIAVGADTLVHDAGGLTVIPGLIDIHVHGAGGFDFLSAAGPEDIAGVARTLARLGTTAFLGTTVHWKDDSNIRLIGSCVGKDLGGASLLGTHIEGPFINEKRRGGIQPGSILPPSGKFLAELTKISSSTIRIMVVAPEIPGVSALLPAMKDLGIVAALGHTDADRAQADLGFKSGIRHVIHTFNAMRPLLHRDPGPLLALYENPDVTCELISDGNHVDPGMVKFFYETIGLGRMALMSDGMRTVGLPEGRFEYYGRQAETKDGTSRYADGTLIGSSLGLLQLVKRFIRFTGCPLKEAIAAASQVPARVIGVQDRKGSVAAGKDADLVLVDADLDPKMTMVAGRIV